MYGLVNAAIQELVCNKFGEDKWNQIKKMAGVQGIAYYATSNPVFAADCRARVEAALHG